MERRLFRTRFEFCGVINILLVTSVLLILGCNDHKLIRYRDTEEVNPQDSDDPYYPWDSYYPGDYYDTEESGCGIAEEAEIDAPNDGGLFVAVDLIADGNRAFFLSDIELAIYDIATPYAPQLVHGVRDQFYEAYALAVYEDGIYILEETLGGGTEVHVYSYAGRSQDPVEVSHAFLDYLACDIEIVSGYMILPSCESDAADGKPIFVYRALDFASDSTDPTPVGSIDLGDVQITSISVFGNYLFGKSVATTFTQNQNIAMLNLSSLPNIQLVGTSPISGNLTAVWVDGTRLYAGLNRKIGDYYHEILSIVDFTNTGVFTPVSELDITLFEGSDSSIYSMVTRGNYLYIAEGLIGGELSVLDLSSLTEPLWTDNIIMPGDRVTFNRILDDGALYMGNTDKFRVFSLCESNTGQ